MKQSCDEELTTEACDETGGLETPDNTVTERQKERFRENQKFVPVIVKRNDETGRHPDDTLEAAIEEGLAQLNRSTASLVLSSVVAGLIVGFSPMAVAVVITAMSSLDATPLIQRLAAAIVYPLGFVICVLSGAQLFTEHTATALYPILDAKAGISKLLRLWLLVIIGNMLGAATSAGLLTLSVEVAAARTGYLLLADHLVHFRTSELFVSSLLAGWLMALGSWLATATARAGSQMVAIFIVTFLIGLGGLHHSIAGSVEMFTGLLLSDDFSAAQASRFILTALIGNLVGGSCFVALLNYAHIRRTQTVD